MANTYDVGDKVRNTATFTNAAGTETDPTSVTVIEKNPAGTKTTYVYLTDSEVVRSTKGVYYIDVAITLAGTWTYNWAGTTACMAAAESYFLVRASEL